VRRSLRVVIAVSFLVTGAAACTKGSASASCANPTAATSVDLQDYAYAPACTQAAAGATLTLHNSGSQPHSFTVQGTGVNILVKPGTSAEATLAGIAAGTYKVVCTIHPQMVGALKIG